MATWKSRGLRGSLLEEIINRTNEHYRESGIALVQKIPTPITPIEIDSANRHITLAYFDQKSTVDYVGLAQGVPLCFDCKECAQSTFALQNVHDHQVLFMRDFVGNGGVAFLLIYYSEKDTVYFMPYEELNGFYERSRDGAGARKSIRYDELNPQFLYPMPQEPYLNYLEFVNDYLDSKENA